MNYKEAINASQIWAARGYDAKGVCVVAICYYGDKLMWLPGFGGNWEKKWKALDEEEDPEKRQENYDKLATLQFFPTGPKPDEQIQAELLEMLGGETEPKQHEVTDEEMRQALEEIAEEYEWADEIKDDYFEPMGESYD